VEKSAQCEDGKGCKGCAWPGCRCGCHGLRGIVPALPRARAERNDATKSHIDPLGLPEEQKSRNKRGAAMARAALRGELGSKEALEDK